MKKAAILTAAFVAAVVVLAVLTLPPARQALAITWSDGSVAGVLHVHTNRSDGRGTPDEIAAAAARAGLKFVVFTDHGDATRPPDAPTYRSGVLCLDGVEISTTGGHYIALDMGPAPYPLGGEPRDVVEDVKRLGGFGIAAHPDSPKPELKWREWTAPFDGLEMVNPDTSWREWMQARGWRPKFRLLDALLTYPIRGPETIASLIQPPATAYQWAALAHRRRVVIVAGTDAHANLALKGGDPGDAGRSLPLPSYEASFRTLSVHVRPERPLSGASGAAAADAALILHALRDGHLYNSIDGVASPPAFELTATSARGTVREGDELGVGGGPIALHVRSNAPPGFTTTILKGTQVVAGDRREPEFSFAASDAPAVYRVEIRPAGDSRPWLISNAIYVRSPAAPGAKAPGRPPATASDPIFDGRSMTGWAIETEPGSRGELDLARTTRAAELRLHYTLGSAAGARQYVALRCETRQGVAPDTRVAFTAHADRPLRISVQLRTPSNDRWVRSVFVDTFEQEHTVYFDDLMPASTTATFRPPLAEISNVIFVVDRTNTKAGASGQVSISAAALQR